MCYYCTRGAKRRSAVGGRYPRATPAERFDGFSLPLRNVYNMIIKHFGFILNVLLLCLFAGGATTTIVATTGSRGGA